MATNEEAKKLRDQARSLPTRSSSPINRNRITFCRENLPRIGELLQYKSSESVGGELLTRVAAAETLKILAEQEPAEVADFTGEMLTVLEQESQRQFANVESMISELDDRSRQVMGFLLDSLCHTVKHSPEPLENEDTVELLLEVDRRDIAPTSISQILSILCGESPELIAPYVTYLQENIESENPDRRYYTLETFVNISDDYGVEPLIRVQDQLLEPFDTADGGNGGVSNSTRREREMAAQALHTIAQYDPSAVEISVPELLSIASTASDEVSVTFCALVKITVAEDLETERTSDLLSHITDVLPEVPPDGKVELLDAVGEVADEHPEKVAPFVDEVGEYLSSETSSVIVASTDVIRQTVVPDKPGLVKPFSEEIIDNLSDIDRNVREISAFLIRRVTENDPSIFKDHINIVFEAAQNEEGVVGAILHEAAIFLIYEHEAKSQKEHLSKDTFPTTLDSSSAREQILSSQKEAISEVAPDKLPAAEEILDRLRSTSSGDEYWAAIMFAALCKRKPDQAKTIVPDVLSLSVSSEKVSSIIFFGLVIVAEAHPDIISTVCAYFDDSFPKDKLEVQNLLLFLHLAVAHCEQDVVNFLLDHSTQIKELLVSSEEMIQHSILNLLGEQISEHLEVGKEYIDAFVKLCDSKDVTTVSVAVHNIRDVAEHDPDIVAPYINRVGTALESTDPETQYHAAMTLGTVCGFSDDDVDVVALVEQNRDALLALIEDSEKAVRFSALTVFQEYAWSDPVGASADFEAVLRRLSDQDYNVRWMAVRTIGHIIRTNETDIHSDSIVQYIDQIVPLLEKDDHQAFEALDPLLKLATIVPERFLDDEDVMETITSILNKHSDQPADPWDSGDEAVKQRWTGLLALLERKDDETRLPTWTNEVVETYDHEQLLNSVDEIKDNKSESRPSIQEMTRELISDQAHKTREMDLGSPTDDFPPSSPTESLEGDSTSLRSDSNCPDTAVELPIEKLAADDPGQRQEALEQIVSAAKKTDISVEAHVMETIANCLSDRSLRTRELVILALDAVDGVPALDPGENKASDIVTERIDAIAEVLEESIDEVVTTTALGLACVASSEDLAPHLDVIETNAKAVDTPPSLLYANMIFRKLVEAGVQDVKDRDNLIAAGFENPVVASTAAKSFTRYVDKFGKSAPETINAASVVLESPHKYDEITIRGVLLGFGRLSAVQSEDIVQYVDEISGILTSRYDLNDDTKHVALLALRILSENHPDAVAPYISRIELMVQSEDERHIKAVMSTLLKLAEASEGFLDLEVTEVVHIAQTDDRKEIREKAAEVLALNVTKPDKQARKDAVESLIPHCNELLDILSSADGKEAKYHLNTLGALSDQYPPIVGKGVDTIASHLTSDDEAVRRSVLYPLANTVHIRPKVVFEHLAAIIRLLDDVKTDEAHSAVRILRAVADEDTSQIVSSLEEVLDVIGTIDSTVETELTSVCGDALGTTDNSLDSTVVLTALDAVMDAERVESVRNICEGLRQLTHSEPGVLDPYTEPIIKKCEQLLGTSPAAATELLKLLSALSQETPSSVIPHMEQIHELLHQSSGDNKLEIARLITTLMKAEPRAGVNYADDIAEILINPRSDDPVTEAIIQLQILCEYDPSIVIQYADQVAAYLSADQKSTRRAAAVFMELLATVDPTEVIPFTEDIRDGLGDDADIATPATRTVSHLIAADVLTPTESDLELLLTCTDDTDLAEARLTALRNIINKQPKRDELLERSLREWTKHEKSDIAAVAIDVLCRLATVASLNQKSIR